VTSPEARIILRTQQVNGSKAGMGVIVELVRFEIAGLAWIWVISWLAVVAGTSREATKAVTLWLILNCDVLTIYEWLEGIGEVMPAQSKDLKELSKSSGDWVEIRKERESLVGKAPYIDSKETSTSF
jgi:hypothetical protein